MTGLDLEKQKNNKDINQKLLSFV